MVIKRSITQFVYIVGEIVNTYKNYPYFSTPDFTFEKQIEHLLPSSSLNTFTSNQISTITETMNRIICFIAKVLPSTAIDKGNYISRLETEKKKIEKEMNKILIGMIMSPQL